MDLPILAVDTDSDFSRREKAGWDRRGFATVRVDTMREAIELITKQDFMVIFINADSVNYLPMLRIMADMSSTFVFIATSDFSVCNQVEALCNGAKVYAPFQRDVEENILSALALLQSLNEEGKPTKRTPKIITSGNLTVFSDYNKVFCNDTEVILTPMEYGVLCYLLINRNITLTFRQIARKVWRVDVVSNNAMWQVIHRLSGKLDEAGFDGGKIINFRGVGYRFSAQPDR